MLVLLQTQCSINVYIDLTSYKTISSFSYSLEKFMQTCQLCFTTTHEKYLSHANYAFEAISY